jgi:hypothetical protein
VAYAGYILALIGGILLVIFGIISIFSSPFVGIFTASFLGGLSAFTGGVLDLILGVVAIAGAKWVSRPVWGIVLLIVGIIAGGAGGVLVFLGALLGLISTLIKSSGAP